MEAVSDIQKGGVSAFAGGGGGLNPGTAWEWFSHFMETAAAGGYTFSSASGGAAAQYAGSSSLFGSATLHCGSTATAGAYGQVATPQWYLGNSGEKTLEAHLHLATAFFDGTTHTGRLWFGWAVGANNFQHAIGFRKVNSGNLEAVCINNYSEAAVDTGIAMSDTTFRKFTIKVNADGTSVGFYVDDTLVATITTNIPATQAIQPLIHIYRTSATTQLVMVEVDWLHQKLTYPTPIF